MDRSARLLATCALLALAGFTLAGCQREASAQPPDAASAEAPATSPATPSASGPASGSSPLRAPAPVPTLIAPVLPSATPKAKLQTKPSPHPREMGMREIAIDAPAVLPTLSLPAFRPPASPHPSPVAGPPPGSATQRRPVAEQRFAPRNDCANLPGWPAFREKLAKSIAEKDAKAFARLARPDVKLDYGGGSGRAALRRRLDDRELGLWSQLAQIMPLGCAVADGIVAMPWYFWNLPTDIDAHHTMLVTGDAVPLRAKPEPDARTLATLDWPMVTMTGGKFDPGAKYTPVRTRAGKLGGYVQTARLRSVLGYRLIAERRDGTWRITAFITGD